MKVQGIYMRYCTETCNTTFKIFEVVSEVSIYVENL